MKLTPEQALQNLDRAAAAYAGTRHEHALLSASVRTIRGGSRNDAATMTPLEALQLLTNAAVDGRPLDWERDGIVAAARVLGALVATNQTGTESHSEPVHSGNN